MSGPLHDLVIRNGLVADGGGGPAFEADVAVSGGVIRAVGRVAGSGAEEIDAAGLVVTPGFVDIHTHYDGQVTWDERLSPSTDHGVTTVVTGNCGVGFAPCRPADRDNLIKIMEGVEDIPEVVMAAGLPWTWETFPEFMDALARRRFDADVAVQIPHSPVRLYVMGERAMNQEASTAADRQAMAELVREAVTCGALGVSTSRSLNHRTKAGAPAPSVISARDEALALADGLRAASAGVFQLVSEFTDDVELETVFIRRIAERSGRPVSFSLIQTMRSPDTWPVFLRGAAEANAAGAQVRAQIAARPVGMLLGLDLSLNPFMTRPSYQAIAHLGLAQRVAALRDPALKARILAEDSEPGAHPVVDSLISMVPRMFALGADPDYAPPPHKRAGERAAASGVSAESLVYDLLLEDEGRAILCLPGANFVDGTLSVVRRMMTDPHTVIALGDGGAHLGILCDAGYPTHLLSYWARDVDQTERFPLEWAVAALTRRPAEAVGLLDRGLVAAGCKADLNIIDPGRLRLHSPRAIRDLPSGGRRLIQEADGYVATVLSGQVTRRNGAPTGALPGRLVRGAVQGH